MRPHEITPFVMNAVRDAVTEKLKTDGVQASYDTVTWNREARYVTVSIPGGPHFRLTVAMLDPVEGWIPSEVISPNP